MRRRRSLWTLLTLATTALTVFVCDAAPSGAASSETGPPQGQILPPGRVVALAGAGAPITTPVDGRLRGPDFSAEVTGVAWPEIAGSGITRYVAPSGHRMVVFSLSLAQPPNDVGPFTSGNTTVTAALTTSEQSRTPIDLSSVDKQIQGAPQGSATGTGTGTFVASMPANRHSVDLVITEGSFSQRFSLWTLKRVQPFPAVIYRDPKAPTVPVTQLSGATIPVTNPANGFSSPAAVTLERGVLTAFMPDGTNSTPPSASDAYFAVTFQSKYPELATSDPNWGHFLANMTPLPGSALTFTAPNQPPVTANAVNVTAPSDQDTSGNVDGLLDATYVFTVPATTTTGTLTIAPGPATGVEFTGFVGGSPIPLEVGGPTNFPITFQDPPAASVAIQPKPPWVGAPLPATGSEAAADVGGLASRVPAGSSSGLPIWLALIILAILVVAALIIRVVLRRRRGDRSSLTEVPPLSGDRSRADEPVAEVGDSEPADPVHDPAKRMEPVDKVEAAGTVRIPGNRTPMTTNHQTAEPSLNVQSDPPPVATMESPELDGLLIVSVCGPVEISDWNNSERPITKELGCYLALHNDHLLGTDQLLLALWPTESDRKEATRKTLHNYLSRLRQAVGPEHLPDAATTGGYQLLDVVTDWQRFQALNAEAEGATGVEANRLRSEALSLVRGVPFEGVAAPRFAWVFAESWATDLTVAIVGCAHRLSTDLYAAGDLVGSIDAARKGLTASPKEYLLWEDTARATIARRDAEATRRMWRDLTSALGVGAAARIRQTVNS